MPSPYSSQPDEASGIDTLMQSNNPTTNYGGNDFLLIGEQAAAVSTNRTLIKFDLTSIPSTATILTAVLTLWVAGDFSTNARDFKIYRVLRDWVESQATWNIWKTANNWTTAGCGSNGNDADLTTVWATKNMSAAEPVGTAEDFTFSATGITELQKMINGTYPNYGWLIKADTEVDDLYNFRSSAYATAGLRPRLVITYLEGGQVMTWSSG